MATIKNKKISDFPKSTGPVRISTWKNRVIISAKGETGFVSTPSRKFNAARFSLLRKLFSPTRLFVKAGFAHFKGRPSDRALKLNYRSAFPQRSSSVKLCFPNIVFSEGSLPIPSNLKASALSSNIILFSWSDSFCADASLMVLLYNPELNQAIVNMTSAGSKFGGLMEKQSKTINGQISNIQDSIDVMFNEIGKSSEGIINGALGAVSTLVENYETLGKILVDCAVAYGTYKAAVMAVAAMQALQTAGVAALTTAETVYQRI